jgi:D-alanyl-D-alanine dipeptidase
MRYFSDYNFTSQRVPGYEANKCLLVKDAAQALGDVQHELHKQGFSLKVYDCYRPQMAVDYFMRWTADASEVSMKQTFYPNEKKNELVSKGYIAERSGHSRGDSIDLTLVHLPAATQPEFDKLHQQDCTAPAAQRFADNSVDMGTGYDCFDIRSNTQHPEIQGDAYSNRLLLQQVMEHHGFINFKKEWWHYTYSKPYGQKQFYNFPIK